MFRRALRILLRIVAVLVLIVVALNWTYGRLPSPPHPTGSFTALADGLRLHYLERPGAEPAVLLIHGLPGTAEDFNEVTALLPGRRTVAIDRPGYGFSTGGYFPFDRQLRAVQEVIDKLHLGHPVLVGHSYGGAISLAFAERHPGEVRGLVLVDAAATCTRVGGLASAQSRLLKVMELPVVRQIANATFSQLLLTVTAKQADGEAFDPAPVNPAHIHRVLAINMQHGNLEALAGERLAANGVVEEVNRGLRAIHVPAVVIQGASDELVKPQCGRRLAAELPDARLEMVSGGHMAPYTHPRVIAAAVQSLAGAPGPYPLSTTPAGPEYVRTGVGLVPRRCLQSLSCESK
jgi:pimeloyl-ACP methyl ester carboxylesterase